MLQHCTVHLEKQFRRHSQEQVHIELVMMRSERLSSGATGEHVHNWRLHLYSEGAHTKKVPFAETSEYFEKAELVQVPPNETNNASACNELVAHIVVIH